MLTPRASEALGLSHCHRESRAAICKGHMYGTAVEQRQLSPESTQKPGTHLIVKIFADSIKKDMEEPVIK